MLFETIVTKLIRTLDILHLKNSELLTGSLFLIATDAICALKYSESLAPGTFCDKSNRCYLGKQQMLFGAISFYTPCHTRSGRIFVLHAPGISELEGILNFSILSGKLSPKTFGNVSET